MAANIAGCGLFFGLLAGLLSAPGGLTESGLLLALGAAMLPMMLVDARHMRRVGAYMRKHPRDLRRISLKLLGLYATFALLLGVYWMLPEYHGAFYTRFHALLQTALALLAVMAVPYFYWMDPRTAQPEDGHYHLGLLLTGHGRRADRRMVAEHGKAWAVKGFFLPLMVTYLFQNIEKLAEFTFYFDDFLSLYYVAYHLAFSLDLLFACTGYIMTLRLFNTQIASAEPTVLGWLVCLMCYQPLWGSLFYPHYLTYDDGYYWDHMVAGMPILRVVWGLSILLCVGIYAWATVAFGYRFSNLTYRGLVSCGPYRITKHPAYVFKCISWWLVSVPFIASQSMEDAVRQSLMLAALCYIYYLRARTEENHLSNYPEYVAYAEAMNRRSLFAPLARIVPGLAYSHERALRADSRVYAPYASRTTVPTA